MIRKAIIVALLTGSTLIVWVFSPYDVPSFVLTLVLLIACAVLWTRHPVQRHRAVRVGLVVGIIAGVAATNIVLLAPLPVSPTGQFFLWPSIPGVALLYVIQGTASVRLPGIPVLTANVLMYSFAALVVAGLIEAGRRFITLDKPTGHCQKCGYNLRGLPEPRCPECSTPFDPATIPPCPTDARD